MTVASLSSALFDSRGRKPRSARRFGAGYLSPWTRPGLPPLAIKAVGRAIAAGAFAGLFLAGGCATAPMPLTTSPGISAASASTQPVISSCVNDATVEFDSSWSSFRFATQSNQVTVKLTTPAPPLPPTSAPEEIAASQPSGASDVQTGRGGVTPDAIRGGDSTDAVRGYAHVAALRGSSLADNSRGTAEANVARGTFTVAVVRGGSEAISARHDNSSAVVRPDLTVALKADPPAAAPGDTVIYTVTIKNISSIEARDVTLTDYLPEQMEILSATGASVVPDPDDSSTHLTIPGTIGPGGSITVQLVARVKPLAVQR